ncbi:LysM domain protein [Apiospora sp. TS-2023a]
MASRFLLLSCLALPCFAAPAPAATAAKLSLREAVSCNYQLRAKNGDTCDSVADNWGLSTDDFAALNPGVNCPTLAIGHRYCVLGSVSSAPTTTAANPPAPTKAPTKTDVETRPTTTAAAGHHSPSQPGLAENCDKFHLVESSDSCYSLAQSNGISLDQFYKWNPYIDTSKPSPTPSPFIHIDVRLEVSTDRETLKLDCGNLWADYWVCVGAPGGEKRPSPLMPGVVDECKKFHKVQPGDSCYSIEQAAGISFQQFRQWNTQTNAQCSNLWADYHVCTGV